MEKQINNKNNGDSVPVMTRIDPSLNARVERLMIEYGYRKKSNFVEAAIIALAHKLEAERATKSAESKHIAA